MPLSLRHASVSQACDLINGSYTCPPLPALGNLFEPVGQASGFIVPSNYGNANSSRNVEVDSPEPWTEFGWLQAGTWFGKVDIDRVLAGFSVTWTEFLDFRPATAVTLTSDSFASCSTVSRVRNNFTGTTEGLSGNTITLTTPSMSPAGTYQATWLVECTLKVRLAVLCSSPCPRPGPAWLMKILPSFPGDPTCNSKLQPPDTPSPPRQTDTM